MMLIGLKMCTSTRDLRTSLLPNGEKAQNLCPFRENRSRIKDIKAKWLYDIFVIFLWCHLPQDLRSNRRNSFSTFQLQHLGKCLAMLGYAWLVKERSTHSKDFWRNIALLVQLGLLCHQPTALQRFGFRWTPYCEESCQWLDMTWPDLTNTLFSTLFALAPCLAVSVVRKVLTRRCKGLANAEISRGYQE